MPAWSFRAKRARREIVFDPQEIAAIVRDASRASIVPLSAATSRADTLI
jgi:hypothetical protein